MSLHASLLMIKGDHLDRAEQIFTAFDYRPTGTVEHLDNWLGVLQAIDRPRGGAPRDIVHKAVFVHNGWTVILDPEMVMFANDAICTQMSRALGGLIFGMLCEGTSGSYCYSLYDGELVRAFWSFGGEISKDRGDRLPEEDGIDLEHVFEDDVLKVMERLGVDYVGFEDLRVFQVFELDESHMSGHRASHVEEEPLPPGQESKKPWWKFW